MFSSATTIRFKKRGVTGVRYCITQVGTPLQTVVTWCLRTPNKFLNVTHDFQTCLLDIQIIARTLP